MAGRLTQCDREAEPLRIADESLRDAVLSQDAEIVTMEQGMTTLRVAEACIEAAKLGNAVTFWRGSGLQAVSCTRGMPAVHAARPA